MFSLHFYKCWNVIATVPKVPYVKIAESGYARHNYHLSENRKVRNCLDVANDCSNRSSEFYLHLIL